MNVQMQTMVALGPAYAGKRGGGVIADYSEINLLDTGAIAIFDEENNLLPNTVIAADVAKVQKFYIAQGGSTVGSFKLSYEIDRDAYTQWYNEYNAPVAQMSRIGKVATVGSWNLPTLVNGDRATVIVTNKSSLGRIPNEIYRYEVALTAVDTVITMIAKFVAAINADPNAIVVATSLNDGTNDYLQLTGNLGITFGIGVDDVAVNATKSEHGTNGTTDYFSGFGTLAKVKAAVREDSLTRGDAYRLYDRSIDDGNGYFSSVEITDGLAAGNFHGWTFQWKEEAVRAADTINTANPVVALFILTTATGLDDINTILGVLLLAPNTGAGGSPSGISSGEGVTVAPIPVGGEG